MRYDDKADRRGLTLSTTRRGRRRHPTSARCGTRCGRHAVKNLMLEASSYLSSAAVRRAMTITYRAALDHYYCTKYQRLVLLKCDRDRVVCY